MREVRARDERTRRGDLADAIADAQLLAANVEVAVGRVASCRAAVAAARASHDQLLARGAAAAAIAAGERYLRRLRRGLDAALDDHLRAGARHRGQLDAVDTARGRLALARAEREVIERHFATWRAERHKLAERRED